MSASGKAVTIDLEGESSGGAGVVDLTQEDEGVVDLTQEDEETAVPPPRTSSAAAAAPSAGLKRTRDASALVRRLALPGGVLDPSILNSVEMIAQQSNCVGCDGRGLAAGVAATLTYGCPYRARRRMPPANKFAVPEDRPTPGTSASTRVEPCP